MGGRLHHFGVAAAARAVGPVTQAVRVRRGSSAADTLRAERGQGVPESEVIKMSKRHVVLGALLAALVAMAPATAAAQAPEGWTVPADGRRPPGSAGRVGQQQRHAARASGAVGGQDRADRRGVGRVPGRRGRGDGQRSRRRLRRPARRRGAGRNPRRGLLRLDRQLQPVLARRARLRQPDVADRGSGERTRPGPHSGRGARRPRPAAAGHRGEGRHLGGPPAERALRHLRRAVALRRLQQLLPDLPEPRSRGRADGDDPRRPRHPDRRAAAPRPVHPPASRRLAGPLGG